MNEVQISKRIKILCVVMVSVWLCAALIAAGAKTDYQKIRKQIQYKISVKKSPYVQQGWKIWINEGSFGYKNAVVKKISLFGKEISENSIYETEIVKKPVSAMLITGSSKNQNPISVPKESYAHYTYNMEATAYDPSPESNSLEWAGITALGWRTRYGIAAVDPKVIALRSLIYVEGYGLAWAGDTGGDIKGKRIDLCYNTTKEALRWGRRKVKVHVLGIKPWSFYRDKKIKTENNEK